MAEQRPESRPRESSAGGPHPPHGATALPRTVRAVPALHRRSPAGLDVAGLGAGRPGKAGTLGRRPDRALGKAVGGAKLETP